jgi:hypothetical protein
MIALIDMEQMIPGPCVIGSIKSIDAAGTCQFCSWLPGLICRTLVNDDLYLDRACVALSAARLGVSLNRLEPAAHNDLLAGSSAAGPTNCSTVAGGKALA